MYNTTLDHTVNMSTSNILAFSSYFSVTVIFFGVGYGFYLRRRPRFLQPLMRLPIAEKLDS